MNQITLNDKNEFKSFLESEQLRRNIRDCSLDLTNHSTANYVNPRQHILENFKEISRIMTDTYINEKKNQGKY